MLPEARLDNLLTQEVGDELVVYDRECRRAHRLNRAAALIWRHCDGKRTLADLTALLQRELKIPANEAVACLALEQLAGARLLQERLMPKMNATAISRRQLIRQLGLAGGLMILLPVVTSIAAPTPAMAASTKNIGAAFTAEVEQSSASTSIIMSEPAAASIPAVVIDQNLEPAPVVASSVPVWMASAPAAAADQSTERRKRRKKRISKERRRGRALNS